MTATRPADHDRRPLLTGGSVIVLLVASIPLTGCQTPNAPTAVPPPGTGMIGQPAPYGGWASQPQGAAYPPSVSSPPLPGTTAPPPGQPTQPMPGPATQWQSASPTAQPQNNSWSWSQPSSTQQPSIQQYGQQLQNSANQYQQNATNQAQQYANQVQAQPQQWANQAQQTVTNQQQQATQQLQNTANQYQQQFNNAAQQGQQQVTAQMPQYQPQTSNSWNPFATSATSLPPARSTPATSIPSY